MAAALASPARIAPSSQTMDSSLSPSKPPPSPESGVSGSSSINRPDLISRSLSLSRNGDIQSSGSMRSEEYRQLFRLPSEEVLVQDFNCALQENILLQGHMYLFDHYICFYSNIFGFETKKIIPFQDVTSVRRAKTAGIFPNAIEIVAGGRKHFFASFLSRDEAFKLITDGWSLHGDSLKGVLDRQDSRSDTSSQLNGDISVENGNSSDSPVGDIDSDQRSFEPPVSEGTKLPPKHEDNNAGATALEVPDVVEEKRDTLVEAEPSTSSGSVKETQDVPEIPECYTKVAESKFPINVQQFFNLFFSDDAVGFVESFHKRCGDKDLRCTSWSSLDKLGYTREKSFQHPIKVYFGAKCGGCKETQKFRAYKNSHLVIEILQEVSDVPYADYFHVEGLWVVQKDGDQPEECILQVYVNVIFSKKTFFKGKIEQSTIEEYREACATWTQLAHELLKQKNIVRTEGPSAHLLLNGQVSQANNGEFREHSETSHRNNQPESTSDAVANSCATHQQTRNPLQGTLFDASTFTSVMRAFAVKLYSFLKRQNNLQLFMVVTFSVILLLMQLSIVVLLSKPQQVYVIPQADHITTSGPGAGHRAAEAMAWMEKRVHLLKDEMLVVEAQLERMRHEHILLKSQLQGLERLNK